MRLNVLTCLGAMMLCGYGRLAADTFQNGSFEAGPSNPSFSGGSNPCVIFNPSALCTFIGPYGKSPDGSIIYSPSTYTVGVGDTAIPGWIISQGSIDINLSPAWQASSGTRSIDLDGGGPGTIQQTFDTIVGQIYRVSFDLASNFYFPLGTTEAISPQIKQVNVTAPGYSHDYSFDSYAARAGWIASGFNPPDMGWTRNVFTFTATSASSTLTFRSLDPSTSLYGAELDNVSIGKVPEPAVWATVFSGLMLLAVFRFRRRRII